MYTEAINHYRECLILVPNTHSSLQALAFTYHIVGSLDLAVQTYHHALSMRPDDTFSTEMLTLALSAILQSAEIRDFSKMKQERIIVTSSMTARAFKEMNHLNQHESQMAIINEEDMDEDSI